MKLMIATKNKGKVNEIKKILRDLSGEFELYDLNDFNMKDVVEDGRSFEQNALIKAMEYSKVADMACLSDDSGLVVPYLNGEPGVYTARYAGQKASDDDNIVKLLNNMKHAVGNDRKAYFVSAAALALPDGTVIITRGECVGSITIDKKGSNGFGYDPVFYVKEYLRTFAELSDEEKNAVSHRAKALKKMNEYLSKLVL